LEENKRNEQKTLDLILKIWALFLIGLHALGFIDESYFPGFRTEPLEREDIIWKAQRVIFFGIMCLGFLTDILQMRINREKAYQFLFLSLVLSASSGYLSAYQYKIIATFFGVS
jgi:hypothetical protein